MNCSVRQNIAVHCSTTLPHITTPESPATPPSRIGLQVYLAACARWRACARVRVCPISTSHIATRSSRISV